MAEWSRNKVDSTQLNNGNEFDNNSDLALDEINAVVNSGLYSQDFAEHLADTPDTSEAGNIGTPTVSLVDNIVGNKTFKKFKFSNLKGTKGDKGEQGEQGPQGEQGEQGLFCNWPYRTTVGPGFGNKDITDVGFNVAPKEGQYICVYWVNTSNNDTYLVFGNASNIEVADQANRRYNLTIFIETHVGLKGAQGTDGKDALTTSYVFSETTDPNPQDIMLIDDDEFNRTPENDEDLIVLWNNTTTGDTFICNCKTITNISAVGTNVKILNYYKLNASGGGGGSDGNNPITSFTYLYRSNNISMDYDTDVGMVMTGDGLYAVGEVEHNISASLTLPIFEGDGISITTNTEHDKFIISTTGGGGSGSTLTFKNYSSWSDLITDLKSLFGTGAANILTLYIGDATTSTETTLYGTSTNLTSGTVTGSSLTYSLFRGMGSVGYKLSSFRSGVFEFFASYFDTGNNLITDALMINTFGVGSISIYRTISSCLTSNSGELTFYTGKFSYDLDSLPMPLSLRVEYLQ